MVGINSVTNQTANVVTESNKRTDAATDKSPLEKEKKAQKD